MDQKSEQFDCWCIVELFGHQKIAGRVTEATIGGQSFVRVDVPESDGCPAFTKFFGAGAIYSITPTTEDLVRQALPRIQPAPVSIYIPLERSLPPGSRSEDDDDGGDF